MKVFLENDATQTQEYKKVWHYKDWATEHPNYSRTDIGIDLVAELSDSSGFCAIQCKFYSPTLAITKEDLDSFVSASTPDAFTRLLLVDTSTRELSKNAQSVFENLNKDFNRLPLSELEESRIDWSAYIRKEGVRFHDRKTPRDHQIQAIHAIKEGFDSEDRGKVIMACGTGKTFTSLCAAEEIAGKGKFVLYMVPSLSLMSQTIRSWKNDASEDFTAFSVCSDIKVGKADKSSDRIVVRLSDLAFPATTDPERFAQQVKNSDPEKMTVVFSTYHSIDVISKSQYEYGLREFDLIICDEAHRTTGATLVGEDESHFVKIHDNANVKGSKRLYMTATPKIYGEKAQAQAVESDVALASMDDEEIYGKTLFYRGFGWAVENNLLTDYKVLVFAVDEGLVNSRLQKSLASGGDLKLDDATKIVGCYKALAKVGLDNDQNEDGLTDLKPMKRALAFCKSIALSKMFEEEFAKVVEEYVEHERQDGENLIKETPDQREARLRLSETNLEVEIKHVDGTFNANERSDRLNWLKDDPDEDRCRVLTNVRCLAEGVDVPALDAVMFLHPRKSQIDVVQSVGRVMRKAEEAGKTMGYVILPITVPPGVAPEQMLRDNERYKVVWQILNALRSHDERFDSTINRIGLGEDVSDRIEIFGVGNSEELEATTAVVEDLKPSKRETGEGEERPGVWDEEPETKQPQEEQLSFVLTDLSQAIKAKIVEKCGTRDYWETWATDIAKIAQAHITRITGIVEQEGTEENAAFTRFVDEIRDDLNPEISESDAIEMLAQHLVTKPVFDTLFQGHNFVEENPVSRAIQGVLGQLDRHRIEKESKTLERFYASVERRAAGISTATGRQQLVLELYDKFFSKAFPGNTERLGIVYTPTEVVDFIIHSVEDVMQQEFGKGLGSPNVHILDPFTGTGTFITRLLQSGVISPDQLAHKYKNEIHANEIILLAYYIATINIEAVYQDLSEEDDYQAFDGAVLTDTFQLYEQERDMIADLLPDNSNRRTAQKERDITVVIANPPYSAGQKSANDNLANIKYTNLDSRITETYAASSSATNKNALYDSYIRAFRWASDRIGDEGIIGFVSGAAWVDRNFAGGMRKHLRDDFSKIYVFHLRGDIRKNMLSKGLAGEGQNVFGQSSMTGIAIAILVKNKSSTDRQILFHDIGKDLDKAQKLSVIKRFRSIEGIATANKWRSIEPDDDHDWINQGDKTFRKYIQMGNKKDKSATTVFQNYSSGLKTSRDAWCYNHSKGRLSQNMERMIGFYNSEVARFVKERSATTAEDFIDRDNTKISWSSGLLSAFKNQTELTFQDQHFVSSLYRPFEKRWMYFHRHLNERVYQIPKIFPNADTDNLVIAVSGVGTRAGFSCLMTDVIPNLHTVDTGQCFPLKLYEKQEAGEGLFAGQGNPDDYVARDGITNEGLQHFQAAYPGKQFTKEDLFYYIYGVLHSLEYRERFQNNLSKELPRIPAVKRFEDFQSFAAAGRKLGDLHVNYESADPFPVTFKQGDLRLADIPDPKSFYRVKKMKFSGKRADLDKTSIVYNQNLTIVDVPLDAYKYIVNGRPALEWVMERQCVKTDKKSGIVNDANDYANETMNNPAYPLELLQRVITVSLETMKIVRSLPALDID